MCGLPASFVVFGTAVLVSIFEMIGLANPGLGIGGGLMLALAVMGGIVAVSSRKTQRPPSFES
jgi:multisubunit Na+/H+ antiporter MnhB subunit